jgi:hypothetical protein
MCFNKMYYYCFFYIYYFTYLGDVKMISFHCLIKPKMYITDHLLVIFTVYVKSVKKSNSLVHCRHNLTQEHLIEKCTLRTTELTFKTEIRNTNQYWTWIIYSPTLWYRWFFDTMYPRATSTNFLISLFVWLFSALSVVC